MNTQLTDDRRYSTVAPQTASSVQARSAVHIRSASDRRSRPPNPLDRLALRIGIALIIWGRRGTAQPSRSELARRYESRISRENRERDAQQRWTLVGPRR